MSHLIGIVGKPSSGKSTFFNAATLAGAQTAEYPFTTIEANEAIGYVTTECPCKELDISCSPNNSICNGGTRMIPVKLLDVAGLVPGAHQGKGMGNKFMDDLMQASVLIHVIDCSGKTNEKGEPSDCFDPSEEISFLRDETSLWLYGIISKNWFKITRKAKMEHKDMIKTISENLSGLGIKETHVRDAIEKLELDVGNLDKLDDDMLKRLAYRLREISKPIIIAANKMDLPSSGKNLEMIKEKFKEMIIVPTSSAIELGLRKADSSGIIDYSPGSSSFTIKDESSLTDEQKKGLALMSDYIDRNGSTGVQECLNRAVFDLLDQIVAYPVENENRYSDKQGNVLPDALIVPKGTDAKNLAYHIHSDIGDTFIHAVDCRKHMRIGADHKIAHKDIIKIASASK